MSRNRTHRTVPALREARGTPGPTVRERICNQSTQHEAYEITFASHLSCSFVPDGQPLCGHVGRDPNPEEADRQHPLRQGRAGCGEAGARHVQDMSAAATTPVIPPPDLQHLPSPSPPSAATSGSSPPAELMHEGERQARSLAMQLRPDVAPLVTHELFASNI